MENGNDAGLLLPRQIWIDPTTASNSLPPTCTPFVLSSGGLINIGQNTVITLTQDAAFQPLCPGTPVPRPLDPTQPGVESVLNYQDPFYSSTNPQIYAIAAVTMVSYMLVIILFITPRTFFVGGVGGGGGFLGHGGIVSGTYGSNSIIGVGSRPWLQTAATVAVAISLTIVTADALKWAEIQYDEGYADATELTNQVNDGLEIRIVRVISETFLWLAQAQTLIRLFPRHKEKLVIKWTAFGLITLELVFSSLNHFIHQDSRSYPREFVSAIPALDYLFALSLNLCYAAFVIYYSAVKRRFAFWNKKMRNMPLVALLSLTAVLIPVIFFILDLSQPNVSGWGNYVRWVGAAAASVIVWEWVERIEALERDEKKDGILGREIFDGDEMLENTPSSDVNFTHGRDVKRQRRGSRASGRGGGGGGGLGSTIETGWNNFAARTKRLQRSFRTQERAQGEGSEPETRSSESTEQFELQRKAETQNTPQIPPSVAASPSTRSDLDIIATDHVIRRDVNLPPLATPISDQGDDRSRQLEIPAETSTLTALHNGLSRFLHPFRRQRNSPPLEVAKAMSKNVRETAAVAVPPKTEESLLQRLGLKQTSKEDRPHRPVIVIPAPPRRRPSPVFEEGHDADNEIVNHADEYEDDDHPIPSPSINRDSPPDAILRAINSPHLSQQGPDQIPESHRPSIVGDTQLSRRGTLLISESRRPGEPPLTTGDWTRDSHSAAEHSAVESSDDGG